MASAAAALLIDRIRDLRTHLRQAPESAIESAFAWACSQANNSDYASQMELMQGVLAALHAEIFRRTYAARGGK